MELSIESKDERTRRLRGLLQEASAELAPGDFIAHARALDDETLLEVLSDHGLEGGSVRVMDSRRLALSALIAERLSARQIKTMKSLAHVGTWLTIAALLLAFVQAAAAAISILQHFGVLHR
jgi:hypothetical protein